MIQKILLVGSGSGIVDYEINSISTSGFQIKQIPLTFEDALSKLDHTIALVLIDYSLSPQEAIDICYRLRRVSAVPIIMLSEQKSEYDVIKALQRGADDFISRPYSVEELLARIRAQLSSYERISKNNKKITETLKLFDIVVNTSDRTCWVGDKEVTLSNKEFDLLAFLMRHPDQIFSREDLFSIVWHARPIGDMSTVTTHVMKLRDKIGDLTDEPKYIETIWGTGYRFMYRPDKIVNNAS